MKKVIFLCLVLIISSVNIYAIHAAKAQQKVKELFHLEPPKVKTPVSLTREIVTRYLTFRAMCTVE